MEYVSSLKKGQRFKHLGDVYTYDSLDWSYCNCFNEKGELVLFPAYIKVEVIDGND